MNHPTKPTTDTLYRVLRGGCWSNNAPWWVRATSRYTVGPANRNDLIGFRCALRARAPRA